MINETDGNRNVNRIGYFSSFFLSGITFVTFGLAITAVPISGVFCVENCIEYPYLDALSHFPKDYYWMFFAIVLIMTYLVFNVAVHSYASIQDKIFSRIGLAFAILSSNVLLLCYFIQFTVIPTSLAQGETEGIALITQYNPHGIFIALEELGYILMSFSFLFIAFVFSGKDLIQRFIRWIFISAFILTIISLSWIVIQFGLLRDYRFEIIVISIDWLVLMINGILTGIVFKRALKKEIRH